MMAKRPRAAGNAAAGLSAGRVVDAVLVSHPVGLCVVVGRVLLVAGAGARVVVVVVLVTEGVVRRRRVVVDARAV